MKKKLVTTLMASALLLATVTGCGNNVDTADKAAANTEAGTQKEVAEITEEADSEVAAETVTEEEAVLVDVGAEYPVSAKYDEYQLVDHYFTETEEDIQMVVARLADGTEYDIQFTFFGDTQQLTFMVEGETLTAVFDKTGFIAKDMEALYEEISASDNWTKIEK